jgi:hypothetical protein
MRYLAVLFLFLSACSSDLRIYNQEKHEIFCADIITEEGGKINLQKLKEILEAHENVGVIRSGLHEGLSVLHEACSMVGPIFWTIL